MKKKIKKTPTNHVNFVILFGLTRHERDVKMFSKTIIYFIIRHEVKFNSCKSKYMTSKQILSMFFFQMQKCLQLDAKLKEMDSEIAICSEGWYLTLFVSVE